MKTRYPLVALLALSTLSCDKAKSLMSKARSSVESEIAKKAGEAPGKADPALQKLVDQTPEGAIFRKDLLFPERLEVRTTLSKEESSRQMVRSAIETQTTTIKGTLTTVTKYERAGNQVRYTMEDSVFQEAGKSDDGKPKEATKTPGLTTKPSLFNKAGNAWKSDGSGDFRTAALAKQLSPVFEELLEENALAPRPMWFSKKRLKPGDKLVVTGATLPMLISGKAKGSFNLTLESFEPVNGHPCGVFSFTGDYTRTDFPDFEGNFSNEDVTIQSGKIWLSLIYPMVLKEEADTIQTFRSGGQGNLSTRSQGTVKISLVRDWKKL